MAQDLHDDPGVHAIREQQRGRRVPPVVQSDLAHVRFAQEGLPGVPIRLPLDRSAVGLRKDQVVAVLPERTGGDALLQLGGSGDTESLDELLG